MHTLFHCKLSTINIDKKLTGKIFWFLKLREMDLIPQTQPRLDRSELRDRDRKEAISVHQNLTSKVDSKW